MSTELQLAALDRDAKAAKARLELGMALDKLRSNRDFNKLITEGYLKDEAVRLVHAKGDASLQDSAMQARIVRDIDAIGSLAAYFSTVRQQAAMAERELAGIDASREDLLAGEE